VLIVVSAVLGVAAFAAIAATYPEPLWLAALAATGMAATPGVLVLVIEMIRIRTGRVGYLFPNRRWVAGTKLDPDPRWLQSVRLIVVLPVVLLVHVQYNEPWWLDLSAIIGVYAVAVIVEITIIPLAQAADRKLTAWDRKLNG